MNIESIKRRQSLCQLLDETRRVFIDAAAARADQFTSEQYREAEVLYADALQRFVTGDFASAEKYAKEASSKACEAKRNAESHVNRTK
jgi:hypothetical protein